MSDSFSRVLTALRKEKQISQKTAAQELGISQALLSHYEKGIRECKLDFVAKAADYYNVSCDYLLGRSPEKTGTTVKLPSSQHDIDTLSKAEFDRKLISNSISIIYNKLENCERPDIVDQVSAYLMSAVYSLFRCLYDSDGITGHDDNLFSLSKELGKGYSDASMEIAFSKLSVLAKNSDSTHPLALDIETISKEFPKLSSSLYTVLKSTEEMIAQLIK